MTIMQLIILLGITLTPQQFEVVTLLDESKTNVQEIHMSNLDETKETDEEVKQTAKEKTSQEEEVKGREDGLGPGTGVVPVQA